MFLKEEHYEIELEPQFNWLWRAWNRLTDERHWQTRGVSVPMGGSIITPFPTRIPWTSVIAWCEEHEYSEEESILLDECLCAMDEIFVKWWTETQAAQSK